MIIRELQAGRPVLYAGIAAFISIYGHSFVCDGYDAGNNLFHFNWGWSGSNNDEWFKIDDLHPSTHNYSHQERMVRYISPANTESYCNIQMSLNDFYHRYYLAHINGYSNNTPSSFLNPPPYLITPKTLTILESAASTSRLEYRTIPSNATATYQAHEEIVLKDGFIVERGSEFTARIEPCRNCENRNVEGNGETLGGDEDEPVDMAPWNPANTPEPDSRQAELHPNPTDGELTMVVDGEVEAVVILDINGNPQGGWEFESISDKHLTLNVSRLKTGAYILTVRHPGGNVESARFIKK